MSRKTIRIGGAIIVIILGIIASPFISVAVKFATAPEIIKQEFSSSDGSVDFAISCYNSETGQTWERGFYSSGEFYDYVSERHPIGSSASSLENYLDDEGFRITECRNAKYASLQVPTTIFSDVRAEIAWRRNKEGKIVQLGVKYFNLGL